MSCNDVSSEELEESSAKRLKVDDNSLTEPKPDITIGSVESAPSLSKKQMKKLKKQEAWLRRKPEMRAREKAKLKQKKLEAKLNNIELGPSLRELKNNTMEKSNCKIHVVVDLSFDDYMNNKALSKCIKQILRCYSLNRRSKNPMQLHVTSFNGKSKEEMSKNIGYQNWDLFFHEKDYMDLFKKEDIIYLSSESDNILSCLEDNKAYIIGGLVDYNSQKGLCHRLAQEKNLQHGQLPIGNYLEMKSRKVLTIDHVFEIILGVSEGKSWKDAFLAVLPPRKGATEKAANVDEEDTNNSEFDEISEMHDVNSQENETVNKTLSAHQNETQDSL